MRRISSGSYQHDFNIPCRRIPKNTFLISLFPYGIIIFSLNLKAV
jgi:hypothetical protein